MRFYDRVRIEEMRALPALPRVLFDLYSFDNIEPAEMARRLGTDISSVTLCITEARGTIAARRVHEAGCRFDPASNGLPIAKLEKETRLQYRQWLEDAMATSGYRGAINWPELSADENAEREAVAALILPGLPEKVRRAVERSRKIDGIAATCRREIPVWRVLTRCQLRRLEREVHYSGWVPFDVWIADRIAPERHYPDGLPISRIKRRPLPEEGGMRATVPTWVQDAFDRLPALTREAFFLHNRYGRTSDEITERLGIGRRSASRRIHTGLHVILTGSPAPARHMLAFDLKLQWNHWAGRIRMAWRAMHGE